MSQVQNKNMQNDEVKKYEFARVKFQNRFPISVKDTLSKSYNILSSLKNL